MDYEFIENNINNCNIGAITYNSDEVSLVDQSNSDIEEEEIMVINGVCPREKIEKILIKDSENTWSQIFIPTDLYIPLRQPDIERIISVNCNVKIISQRVIKTPVLKMCAYGSTMDVPIKNSEGAMITGRKLVVEGLLKQKIIYASRSKNQAIYTTNFNTLFSTSIALPVNTLLTTKYKIDVYIEDVLIDKKSSRNIFNNVGLFFKASPLVFECK